MGGKRPDQHNIDPAEGSSTDHKWRHEGRSEDSHLANEEKQHLKSSDSRAERDRVMNADKKIDEASEESFPASDPPQQP